MTTARSTSLQLNAKRNREQADRTRSIAGREISVGHGTLDRPPNAEPSLPDVS